MLSRDMTPIDLIRTHFDNESGEDNDPDSIRIKRELKRIFKAAPGACRFIHIIDSVPRRVIFITHAFVLNHYVYHIRYTVSVYKDGQWDLNQALLTDKTVPLKMRSIESSKEYRRIREALRTPLVE